MDLTVEESGAAGEIPRRDTVQTQGGERLGSSLSSKF